jgi:hypothetical protein
MPMRLLVTGPPGCGKTTAVQVVVGMLRAVGTPINGFVTRERRGAVGGFVWLYVVARSIVSPRGGLWSAATVTAAGSPRLAPWP